ncbi:MAG: hypothetical protein JXM79_04630 [Sedimentisphaerales bacterium]|nr:hypothetical protein [Sedimentisphaerales bacterium]
MKERSSSFVVLLIKRHFFPLPFECNGQGGEIRQWAMCVSGKRRAYKGHATKAASAADWQGLCRPELLRFGKDSMNVRKAAD